MKNIAPFLDLANHKSNATHADIQKICQAVLKYNFNSAFVNPLYITYAKEQLQGKGKVGTVITFPLGQEIFSIKIAAIKEAALAGANELDISLNAGCIKEARWDLLLYDMRESILCARAVNPH